MRRGDLSALKSAATSLPGAAPEAPCPGYRFTAVCGQVAGTGSARRPRDGARPEDILRFIPRWRLSPYRGDGFTAVCDQVARTGAARRLREGPGSLVAVAFMQLHTVAPIALGDVQRAVGIAQQQIVIRMTGVDGVADAGGNRNLIVSANAKRQLADFFT